MSQRTEKLTFDLSVDDLRRIDDFQFANRLPTRAAAIRELLKRGLQTPTRDSSEAAILGGLVRLCSNSASVPLVRTSRYWPRPDRRGHFHCTKGEPAN